MNREKRNRTGKMKCQKCRRDIPENESFTHLGETLCEDCYMDVR